MVGEVRSDMPRMAMDIAEVLTAERAAARRDPGRLLANALSLSRPMAVENDCDEGLPARVEVDDGNDQGDAGRVDGIE